MECRRGPAYAAGRRPQAAARRQREPVQALANAPVKAMPAPLRRPKAVRPAALARAARIAADPRRQAAVRTNRRAARSKTAVRSKHCLARRRSRRASRLAFQRNRFTPAFAIGQTATSPSSVHGAVLSTWADTRRTTAGRRNSPAGPAVGALAVREVGYVPL